MGCLRTIQSKSASSVPVYEIQAAKPVVLLSSDPPNQSRPTLASVFGGNLFVSSICCRVMRCLTNRNLLRSPFVSANWPWSSIFWGACDCIIICVLNSTLVLVCGDDMISVHPNLVLVPYVNMLAFSFILALDLIVLELAVKEKTATTHSRSALRSSSTIVTASPMPSQPDSFRYRHLKDQFRLPPLLQTPWLLQTL